jgi:hypothetical protein
VVSCGSPSTNRIMTISYLYEYSCLEYRRRDA